MADIYDYNFDLNLNKPKESSPVVYNPVSEPQYIHKLYTGTNVDLTNLTIKSGLAVRAMGGSTGETQTIAHGLGKKPRYIKITAIHSQGTTTNNSLSIGTYDGKNTNTVWLADQDNTSWGNSTSAVVAMYETATSEGQTATATFDTKNIYLAWTAVGVTAGGGNIEILWEAYA